MNAYEIALDAVDKAVADKTDDASLRIQAQVHALLYGYNWLYANDQYEVESVERVFHLPIINPDTGRRNRNYTHAGRFDGIIRNASGRFLIEHKTTSEDIEDPNSSYWRRMPIDSQVSHYLLAAWQDGQKLDGTIYDVLRKPTIRPKDLPAGAKKVPEGGWTAENCRGTIREIVEFGSYFHCGVVKETVEAAKNGWLEREDAILYHHRLLHDVMENPKRYFQRRMIPRLDVDITDYAKEMWEIVAEIHNAKNNRRHYRNSDACMTWGRPCEYLPLCSGVDKPESERWAKRDGVHTELGDGFDETVITNSRIKCFQTCRAKHYYRYIAGLRRADDDEAEALQFGRVWHCALEAWFNTFRKDVEHGNSSCNGPAANVVAGSGSGVGQADQRDGEEAPF